MRKNVIYLHIRKFKYIFGISQNKFNTMRVNSLWLDDAYIYIYMCQWTGSLPVQHQTIIWTWALSNYSDLTLSQEFQPMAAQLSMKAALPLAKILVTASCCSSKTGPSAAILSIRSLGLYFSDILCEIQKFSLKKMHLNMLSAKLQLFCPSLNVLTHCGLYSDAIWQHSSWSTLAQVMACYLMAPSY